MHILLLKVERTIFAATCFTHVFIKVSLIFYYFYRHRKFSSVKLVLTEKEEIGMFFLPDKVDHRF